MEVCQKVINKYTTANTSSVIISKLESSKDLKTKEKPKIPLRIIVNWDDFEDE